MLSPHFYFTFQKLIVRKSQSTSFPQHIIFFFSQDALPADPDLRLPDCQHLGLPDADHTGRGAKEGSGGVRNGKKQTLFDIIWEVVLFPKKSDGPFLSGVRGWGPAGPLQLPDHHRDPILPPAAQVRAWLRIRPGEFSP